MNDREWQELQDEDGAKLGDPRRCPVHGTVISSPDGMFDGLCGACETAMDEDPDDRDDIAAMHAAGFADHEIALVLDMEPEARRVLIDAVVRDGERDLGASAENISPTFPDRADDIPF